jgi:hypothetical protein
MPGENIGPQAHANPNVSHDVEMVQNLLHLKSKYDVKVVAPLMLKRLTQTGVMDPI